MKKTLYYFLLASTSFFISCSDDGVEIPTLEPAFVLDPAIPEVSLPVMFDNQTLNANSYTWDFGDGSTPVEGISPSHTYSEAGTYDVTLTATALDGQSVDLVESVTIRQRIFTGYFVSTFPAENGTEPWDPENANTDSAYADVIFVLFPNANATEENSFLSQVFFPESKGGPIFESIDDNFASLVLTNEDWTARLLDLDPGDFQSIIDFPFNPVTSLTVKDDDGNGVISLVGTRDNGGQLEAIDIEISFQLR